MPSYRQNVVPPLPPLLPSHSQVAITLHCNETVDYFSPGRLHAISLAFASAAGVPVSTVHAAVSAASVRIDITIDTRDEESSAAVLASIAPHLGANSPHHASLPAPAPLRCTEATRSPSITQR